MGLCENRVPKNRRVGHGVSLLKLQLPFGTMPLLKWPFDCHLPVLDVVSTVLANNPPV